MESAAESKSSQFIIHASIFLSGLNKPVFSHTCAQVSRITRAPIIHTIQMVHVYQPSVVRRAGISWRSQKVEIRVLCRTHRVLRDPRQILRCSSDDHDRLLRAIHQNITTNEHLASMHTCTCVYVRLSFELYVYHSRKQREKISDAVSCLFVGTQLN